MMLGGRSWKEWVARYSLSHRHTVNRFCHTFGIPMVSLSVVLFLLAVFFHPLWVPALILFVVGWIFQFVGHAFEGRPPEFLHDWRFLFVGLRWWFEKIRGRM